MLQLPGKCRDEPSFQAFDEVDLGDERAPYQPQEVAPALTTMAQTIANC